MESKIDHFGKDERGSDCPQQQINNKSEKMKSNSFLSEQGNENEKK
jgi:hypothetical protein